MSETEDADKERKSVQPLPPIAPPTAPSPEPPPVPTQGKLSVELGIVTPGATQSDGTEKSEPSIAPPPESAKAPPLIGLRPVLPQTPGVKSFQAGILRNAWKCPNGHILGIILQEQRGGTRITRLGLLPFAFEPQEFVPENILISKIDAGEIACSRCGLVRVWHPGEWITAAFVGKLRQHRGSHGQD